MHHSKVLHHIILSSSLLQSKLICVVFSYFSIVSNTPLETLVDLLAKNATNSDHFCHCMRLDEQLCDELDRNTMQENAKTKMRKMIAAWSKIHADRPSSEVLIKILVCMKKVLNAKRIADQTGVKFVYVDQYP